MKILSTPFYITAFLLVLSTFAKAQDNDYIINNHGDTIQCKIKTPALGGEPKYQPINALHDAYVKITIEEIKEYYLSDPQITFRRIYIDSTKAGPAVAFMRPMERGTISIYLCETSTSYYTFHNTYYSFPAIQWYVTKNSDTATLLKTSLPGIIKTSKGERKDVLAELLKDKKDVYDKYVKENKFDSKYILNIIHLYNTGVELNKQRR